MGAEFKPLQKTQQCTNQLHCYAYNYTNELKKQGWT